MPWTVKAVLYETVKLKNVISLSSHLNINNNQLIDTKWQIKTNITEDLFLYDSVNNTVTKINKTKLKSIIESKKPEIRHWIQIIKNKRLKSLVLYFSPRLEYLFH